MLRRLDLTGTAPTDLRRVLPRARVDVHAAVAAVTPVVEDVAARGYPAVREATLRFDGVDVPQPRVPADATGRGARRSRPGRARRAGRVDPAGPDRCTRRSGAAASTSRWCPGGTVTERWIPVRRVGLYVPGGHRGLPVQRGDERRARPGRRRRVDRGVLAAAEGVRRPAAPDHPGRVRAARRRRGVRRRRRAGHRAGGLRRRRARRSKPVDVITGPGNVYVAAAKRLVRGLVGIDAEAGPTEIAVLADATADPVHVAADLISQAEHDPLAASVLVTDSAELADAVDVEVERQVALTKHIERVRTALSGEQSATVLVRDLEQGLAVVDAYAAEHLEVITADARHWAERVRNAGCIFVGPHAPVSLGDYCAGSNHVLPTGCTARHASGLSVQSFLKGVHLVEYDRRRAGGGRAARARAGRGRGPAGARRGGRRPAVVTTG